MIRAIETASRTDTGRQRRDNEDSLLVREPVFVIADGMGGAQAGEVASRMAVELFQRELPDSGTPEQRLATVVQEANRRIHEISQAEGERQGMGTTLTAVMLDEAAVAIAHVGDSRAYLFRAGRLRRLTQDHSLVAELVRRGKLTEEQAEEHPQRSIITRALGPEAWVEVDTWSYPVRDGDVLLLCSDGLTSMISEGRIASILSDAGDLDAAAAALVAAANDAGGRDNISVILTRVEGAGPAPLDPPTSVAEAPADAPTMVVEGPTGRPSQTEAPARRAAQTEGPSAASPPPPAALSRDRVAPPSTAPAPPAAPVAKRRRRFARPLAALLATLIVLALILGGGYLASRQLYFIGTNSQGIVTIYRGLPYDLPGGIHLYETYYVSGVPAALIPADRRKGLLRHDLRSQSDAQSLVRDLELGRISG